MGPPIALDFTCWLRHVLQQRHPEGIAASVRARQPPALRPTTTTRRPATPLYSFDNSVPPPKLINTGTNYKQILQSLLDYGNWISAHRPDPRSKQI